MEEHANSSSSTTSSTAPTAQQQTSTPVLVRSSRKINIIRGSARGTTDAYYRSVQELLPEIYTWFFGELPANGSVVLRELKMGLNRGWKNRIPFAARTVKRRRRNGGGGGGDGDGDSSNTDVVISEDSELGAILQKDKYEDLTESEGVKLKRVVLSVYTSATEILEKYWNGNAMDEDERQKAERQNQLIDLVTAMQEYIACKWNNHKYGKHKKKKDNGQGDNQPVSNNDNDNNGTTAQSLVAAVASSVDNESLISDMKEQIKKLQDKVYHLQEQVAKEGSKRHTNATTS